MFRRQWPRALRRGSASARLLGLRVLFHWGIGCSCLVALVCRQVEVSESGLSRVQRSLVKCGVSNECNREVP